MNTRSLIFCLMLLATAASAQTWRCDATAVNQSGKNPGHDYGFAIIRASDGAYVTTTSYTPSGGTGVDPFAKTLNQVTLAYDFYVVLFSAPSGLYSQVSSGKKWRWFSAYKVGDPNEAQQSTNGPFDTNGTPTTNEGGPVDPVTATPPSNSFKACVTVSCPADSLEPKAFKITGKEGNSIIYQNIVIISPGETRQICVTNDAQFTLTAQEVIGREAFNPENDTVVGPDRNDPSQWDPVGTPVTVNSEGQTAAPPSSGNAQATNTQTGQAGSAPRPAAASVTRPGSPEGNADARNQELRNELQRVADQVKASGDAIKAGIDDMTNELKGMNSGSGSSGTGAALGTPSPGATSFAASIGDKATGLANALGNLLNAAGLGANPGTNALTWQVPVMGSTHTVSLEEHAGVFAVVRSAILWVASAFFIWAAFSVLRGAFVDEGK